jgi:PmbA protein
MTPEELLELARHRCEAAEVFVVESDETPVLFEANRLKALNTRQTTGLALRIIKDGRIGFASTTAMDEAAELLNMALDVAPFGAEARFEMPSSNGVPSVELYDPATEALPIEDMIELGQSMIDQVRRHSQELQCDGSVRKATQKVHILNTSGNDASYDRTTFSLSLEGTLVRGTDMLFVGDSDASCQPITDVSRVVETTIRQLDLARDMAQPTSGQLPVIFTPRGVAGAIVGPLTIAFSGRTVLQGASPVGNRLGQEAYDRRFSLWDDPTVPWRPGSRPVDGEGVASRRLPLIENGVVANFLYDLQTAGLAGTKSTGSGGRALASPPTISSSCLVFEKGNASLDDMVAEVKNGLVVEQLMGAGQGNVQGGDFAGNVLLGYRIENGKVIGRVKDTMVAGNVHEALKEVAAFGSEPRWVGGSLHVPPIYFARLSVSSKGKYGE